jgi:hypothetical protein
MLRIRRAGLRAACVVGLLSIGCGIVRAVDPTHAAFAVPAQVSVPWPTALWSSLQAPAISLREPLPPIGLDAPPTPVERVDHPPQRPSLRAVEPVRIELPTLGVRAPVTRVAVTPDGALTVPEDPRVIGWWADGGDALVLDGHVDSAVAGPGALFHLVDLEPGDPVSLTGADGAVRRFVVAEVHDYPKATLPADVFRAAGRLTIITCGGHFDRHRRQYDDNIVTFADVVP